MDQSILGELIQIGQQERARQEGMEHDKNIRILNAVLGNQRLDKQATINEEATILADSLAGARDDINFARQDSSNTANIMLQDSLNTVNREDNQEFQRGTQILGLTTGLLPTQNQVRNQEIDDMMYEGDSKYNAIKEKVNLMKQDQLNARRYNPNVRKTRQALGQFFTESAWMGTDEGDIIEGYVNARDNHLEPMVMEVAKLPYGDPKRTRVIKLLDDMLDKRDNEDFQDGGYGPWDADPGGSQAKDIIAEIKSFKTLLESDDPSVLDGFYGITKEERQFYDNWDAMKRPMRKEKRDNTTNLINSLLDQIGKIGQ